VLRRFPALDRGAAVAPPALNRGVRAARRLLSMQARGIEPSAVAHFRGERG
jgi:hypothetical protein